MKCRGFNLVLPRLDRIKHEPTPPSPPPLFCGTGRRSPRGAPRGRPRGEPKAAARTWEKGPGPQFREVMLAVVLATLVAFSLRGWGGGGGGGGAVACICCLGMFWDVSVFLIALGVQVCFSSHSAPLPDSQTIPQSIKPLQGEDVPNISTRICFRCPRCC